MSVETIVVGVAYPLGAYWDGHGVNFALVAPNAQAVELCLFDADGIQEQQRLRMPACQNGVWHGYLVGATPGQIYGYRVTGPYAPQQGHRFNANKIVLDPYARQVVGAYLGQHGFQGHLSSDVMQADSFDNAALALKARVVYEPIDWSGDELPRIPMADVVIYEVHVNPVTS